MEIGTATSVTVSPVVKISAGTNPYEKIVANIQSQISNLYSRIADKIKTKKPIDMELRMLKELTKELKKAMQDLKEYQKTLEMTGKRGSHSVHKKSKVEGINKIVAGLNKTNEPLKQLVSIDDSLVKISVR